MPLSPLLSYDVNFWNPGPEPIDPLLLFKFTRLICFSKGSIIQNIRRGSCHPYDNKRTAFHMNEITPQLHQVIGQRVVLDINSNLEFNIFTLVLKDTPLK